MIEWIVSSSVLIVLVIALRRLLRGRISLRLQYALWLLVLVRLLIPGTVGESALSVQRPLEAAESRIVETPLPGNWAVVVLPAGGEGVAVPEDGGGTPVQGDLPPVSDPEPSTVGVLLQPLGVLLRHLWYAGMAVTGLLLLVSNLAFYRKLRRSRNRIEPEISTKVYVTDAIQSPCLFGVPFPAVYVPAAVAESPEALGHVLAHELSHRRHADHIWTVLRGLCLVLHWYNPLVWWAAALCRRDCELACDEAAVQSLGEGQRAAYGRTLVGLAERHSGLLRCATSMSGSDLKERIAALVAKPTTRRLAAAGMGLAVVVIAVCVFTAARPSSQSWHTPEEYAAWMETGSVGTATVQMRSTYEDGRSYTAATVGVTWVADHITSRFSDYDWTQVMPSDAAEGLCLEIQAQDSTLRLYENDIAELEGSGGTSWYRATYRYGPDVISDSIFAVCREQYDQQIWPPLTSLTLDDVTGSLGAGGALYNLWNTWMADGVRKLPPGSRWGFTDYQLIGTVTGMTTAERSGDVRAAWEMKVLLEPEDYENTSWWIGNAVGAEVDNGSVYAGWIELGYQGWLIYDASADSWYIPDYGTGGYSLERLLEEYPLPPWPEDGLHSIPYEINTWIPTGAEVTGFDATGGDSWAAFTCDSVPYTLLTRTGASKADWTEAFLRLEEAEADGGIAYHALRTSGDVDFYTTAHYTAAVWESGGNLLILAVRDVSDGADDTLESLLAQYPEPLLGTGTSSSAEEAAVYVYEKEGFGGPFTIVLYPDGTFQYYEGYLSSYIGFGTWEMDGNLLTLREHDYGLVNHFTITPEGLVFQAEGSDNFFYKEVAEGDRFLEAASEEASA